MKKLKLDLEKMRVESFSIGGGEGRGTVQANSPQSTDCSLYPDYTCIGNTCWDSCGGSCDPLCGYQPSRVYYNGACV